MININDEAWKTMVAHAEAKFPNEVWTVDFKGWFLTGDGTHCEPLTLSDAYSRYLLRCQALARADTDHVWPVLYAAFREFGLPLRLRSDNGSPFASCGAGGLSRLSVNIIKAGVVPERIARVSLHPVPRTLPSEVAALLEPLACALHATAGIEPQQTVAVLGPGPMGMLLCACLKDAGAEVLIAWGTRERRALAQEFGARPDRWNRICGTARANRCGTGCRDW